MKVNSINTNSIVPVEYSHTHDSKILFRKYRENFSFGLTVDQYYFNKDAKDKKTNYNTQYTLTDLQPLSTITELDIPFTDAAIASFSTTIKHDDKYLKTDYSNSTETVSSVSSTFVASSEFSNLSSQFLYTFTLTSVSVDNQNHPNEDRIIISQEYDSVTWYLSATTTTNTQAWWVSSGATSFRYGLIDNKITILNPVQAGKLCINGDILCLSASPGSFTTAATLSTAYFDINRNILTKDFKYIPNSYTKYTSSFNTDTVDLNTSTVVDHISNNYFVFSNNYNFYDSKHQDDEYKKTTHVDLFPLKNQATLHEYYSENNHFNSEPDYLNRIYEKVNAGTNQQRGHDKIGLSYNIGTYDIVFKPSKLTYFTTPDSMAPYTVLNIKDSKLDKLGAVAGDNPLMSDKVFKRRENIKNNSFSDNTDPVYLCSWLSGNDSGDRRWVDRYYNSNVSNFNSALSGTSHYRVITAAGAETTETFDVSSSLTFEPNNDYIFYHVGSTDYENLLNAYNTTYNEASGVEYLNYAGVPATTNKVKADDELTLDGETFGRFNPDVVGDFSTGFWLHTDDNTLPFGYQIMGNYFDDGFGIFNTDLVTPNIILPVENDKSSYLPKKVSKLLFLNNDFEIYDEVIVMDGVNEIGIKGIGRKDNFSEFYVLGDNNVIYIYNANYNLISKIENLKTSTIPANGIDDFEVGEDKLHVLFNPIDDKKYFTYNTKTNITNDTTSSTHTNTLGEKGKIVETSSGTTLYKVDATNSFGNEISFDSDNKPYIVRRSNPEAIGDSRNYLQKNATPYPVTEPRIISEESNVIQSGLAKTSKVNGVLVDEENNIIVVHDNNIISILDNNRKLKVTREFCNLENYAFQQTYIDLIFDFEDGVYKKYILLIQEFSDGFRLTKLDTNLRLVSSKKFRDLNLGDLKLTKTVTSYYYLQKVGANKNRFKVILKTKPKFSSAGVIPRNKSQIDFDITQLNPGYNHFFVNVSLRKGYMELYVNSKLYATTDFNAGKYAIDNVLGTGSYIGAVSTPYYLTLANRLVQPKKYFIKNAKIKGFKLYNKTMTFYDILAHYNYHFEDKNLIWSYPIGQRTYIDTIDKLMKFNYPEKVTNKYEVEIENTNITDKKLQDKLKDKIREELKKITPYYDDLQNITMS